MNKLKIVALLLLALSPPGKIFGQGDSALLEKIESAIANTEPRWKLARKPRTKNGQYVGLVSESRKSSVFVLGAVYGSAEEATNGLKNLPGFLEEGG